MNRETGLLRKLTVFSLASYKRNRTFAGILNCFKSHAHLSTNVTPSQSFKSHAHPSTNVTPSQRTAMFPYGHSISMEQHLNHTFFKFPVHVRHFSMISIEEQVEITTTGALNYGLFEEHLFHILSNNDGLVPASRLLKALRNAGLWNNDPRFADTINNLSAQITRNDSDGNDVLLDENQFGECIKNNIFLIKRAFTGEFVIPEFSRFCSTIDEMYLECRTNDDGKVASYIPQLAKYSRDYWGVSMCTIDGQRHSVGDVTVPFTLQSACKPFNYALAINELGADKVHSYVGHEPSGESFNCIKLSQDNKPHNPLVNAGAILIASMIRGDLTIAERFDYIQKQYKKISGGEFLGFSNAIYLSEKESANRNFALAYYMKEHNCFPAIANMEASLDFYFQMCSIEVNANAAAVMAATLANGGFCPITDEEVLSPTSVRNTLALMHSCGMYDYSGGFAFKVGLPAKSAVSGAILLVIPNVLGMCLWSPPLDNIGNSVRGVKMCQKLVDVFNFHHYDNLQHTTQKMDPRIRKTDLSSNNVVRLLFGAYNGDFQTIRRLALIGQDMSVADYDGRTALHLTAAEGHMDCAKFLVEKCRVQLNPKDRWGHTPMDDAIQFNHVDIQKFLEECIYKQSSLIK